MSAALQVSGVAPVHEEPAEHGDCRWPADHHGRGVPQGPRVRAAPPRAQVVLVEAEHGVRKDRDHGAPQQRAGEALERPFPRHDRAAVGVGNDLREERELCACGDPASKKPVQAGKHNVPHPIAIKRRDAPEHEKLQRDSHDQAQLRHQHAAVVLEAPCKEVAHVATQQDARARRYCATACDCARQGIRDANHLEVHGLEPSGTHAHGTEEALQDEDVEGRDPKEAHEAPRLPESKPHIGQLFFGIPLAPGKVHRESYPCTSQHREQSTENEGDAPALHPEIEGSGHGGCGQGAEEAADLASEIHEAIHFAPLEHGRAICNDAVHQRPKGGEHNSVQGTKRDHGPPPGHKAEEHRDEALADCSDHEDAPSRGVPAVCEGGPCWSSHHTANGLYDPKCGQLAQRQAQVLAQRQERAVKKHTVKASQEDQGAKL
mmetsp:Transcript_83072/g.230688  ORF Transcript_83072/g.230688 Transcript_83072/m.230688 type:complete len:432 (-) Transcript_83072:266-1561(-)